MPPDPGGTTAGDVTGSIAAESERLVTIAEPTAPLHARFAVSALFAVIAVTSESGAELARAVETDKLPLPASV